MRLETYLRHRHRFEAIAVLTIFLGGAALNSIVAHMDIVRAGLHVAPWEPPTWEFSSALALLLLLPAIKAFDTRFPLARPRLRRDLIAHALFTVPFSLAHVLLMVGMRHLVYRWMGDHYDFGNWPQQCFYEYLKDARTYAAVVAAIHLYELLLRRWQGEASLLDTPDEGVPARESEEQPQRILVKKLGREFLLNVADIERMEAAGNYVNLHVAGRAYPLRETMAGMLRRLDPECFVRVHRSHIVNLDFIGEIEPLDTGDARIHMRSGAQVPFGRRHRATLRGRVG